MRQRLSDIELAKVEYAIWRGDLRKHFSFDYWRTYWPRLVQQLGSEKQLSEDEFLRQHSVTTLTLEGKMIGTHLISEYPKSEYRTHPYFADFDDTFLRALEEHGARRVQSLQYFMIDENFSVAKTLVNFPAILGGLSMRHQTANQLDASVTIARSDVPAASLAIKHGFVELSRSTMHNVPVSMLACFEPKPYPKEEVQKWVDHFWNLRKIETIGPVEEAA